MSSPILGKIKESSTSLVFNLGGIISGTLLTIYLGVFSLTKWAFIVFPGIMSVRGVIGGQLTGKMTSGLHVGSIRPSLRNNTEQFYSLIIEIIFLGFLSTILLTLFNGLAYSFIYGFNIFSFLEIFITIQGTMAISLVVVPPITISIAVITFKRGLDPDKMTYPIISSVADITVAGFFVICILLVQFTLGLIILVIASIIFSIVSVSLFSTNWSDEFFIKEFKTSLSVLVIVSFIVLITGSVFERSTSIIGQRKEIYVIYPAIITTVGDSGAIVGSSATTKIFIGEVEPNLSILNDSKDEIIGTWISTYILFIIYALISTLILSSFNITNFIFLIAVLSFTNLLSIGFIMIIGLISAIITFKKELNPDSFVIPLQTNIADMLATVLLATALIIFI
jgi:mgtE-like transporter